MKIFCLICFIFLSFSVKAQQKPSEINLGTLKGIVFDSVHNYSLPSATIAIYKTQDSTLLKYQLSNDYGEFNFSSLPLDTKLNLIISYIGYKTLNKNLTIPSDKKELDINKLNLFQSDNSLTEVIVKGLPPPVVMNGDTLEFNAAAFSLDENAVIEDLLHKLPGITLWGDGTITVNGRKVKSVLVNGKSFFGNSAEVALQNIPKNSVNKIQVYKKSDTQERDSTLEMNVTLKKNAKKGYFGKLSSGVGTEKRNEFDATINIFSPKQQLQAIAGKNNINRNINNIDAAVRNASFKGIGANTEFNPDFSRPGDNNLYYAGLSYQKELKKSLNKAHVHQLKGGYFSNKSQSENLRENFLQTILNDGNQQFTNSFSANDYDNTNHNFDFKYQKLDDKINFQFTAFLNFESNEGTTDNQNEIRENNSLLLSKNHSYQKLNNSSNRFQFETSFSPTQPQKLNYDIGYSFLINNRDNLNTNKSEFESFFDSDRNRSYNRQYNSSSLYLDQNIKFQLLDLEQLLNINALNKSKINLSLISPIQIINKNNNNLVDDALPSDAVIINQYLSTNSTYHTLDATPSLAIRKSFSKSLYGRFQKNLTLTFDIKGQYFSQKNISEQKFQNLQRSLFSFIPAAGIRYKYNFLNRFDVNYALNYVKTNQFPEIDQLVPLIDSLNPQYLIVGNPHLKHSDKDNLSFNMSYFSDKINTLNFSVSANIGKITNAIADSSIIQNGQVIRFYFNSPSSEFLTFQGQVSKAYKFNNQTVELNLNSSFNAKSFSNAVNNEISEIKQNSNTNSLSILYRYKDYFALNLNQKFNNLSLERNNTLSKRQVYMTAFSASAKINKKLSINSNISYQLNTYKNENIKYAIWNASATHRLLKDNTLEFKISALDLLRQNRNIVNSITLNGINKTTVNVLHQYFMVSTAYYPRFFGKKSKLL